MPIQQQSMNQSCQLHQNNINMQGINNIGLQNGVSSLNLQQGIGGLSPLLNQSIQTLRNQQGINLSQGGSQSMGSTMQNLQSLQQGISQNNQIQYNQGIGNQQMVLNLQYNQNQGSNKNAILQNSNTTNSRQSFQTINSLVLLNNVISTINSLKKTSKNINKNSVAKEKKVGSYTKSERELIISKYKEKQKK